MVAAWDEHLEVALAGATALVSAVPAAAWEPPGRRAALVSLRRSAVVLEMAYGAPTPLAQAVRGRVARYADGLGMLVHQAARAVELALGEAPPVAPMFRAVTRKAP
jgi:shikimate dehydrogenase